MRKRINNVKCARFRGGSEARWLVVVVGDSRCRASPTSRPCKDDASGYNR